MNEFPERFTAPDWRSLGLVLAVLVASATGLGSSCGSPSPDPTPLVDPGGPVICELGAKQLVKTGGDGQTAAAGFPLAGPLEVRLEECTFGGRTWSPVPGATVTWSTSDGSGGRFDPATSTTGSQGLAQTTWTLGPAAGPQGARAAASGATVALFGATASALRSCSTGGTDHGDAMITGQATWTRAGSPHRGMFVEVRDGGSLLIEDGATVCVHQLIVRDAARLFALGTASSPVVFTTPTFPAGVWNGIYFLATTFAPTERSRLSHVLVENAVGVTAVDDYPVEILDSRFVRGSGGPACPQFALENRALRDPGLANVVARSEIVGYGCAGFSGVYLHLRQGGSAGPHRFGARVTGSPGVGVEVFTNVATASVEISACEVSGNASHGILVQALGPPGATVTGCNLTGNGGEGIHFEGTGTVAATGNWWGDPAGPAGPAGDGASPGVDGSSPLAAPVSLGY